MSEKSKWPDGPWMSEPDREEWKDPATGLPCMIIRNRMGVWCGYVAVSAEHSLYKKSYDDAETHGISAHGGLTYASECSGHICHVPAPGDPDDVWWFGFDCGHHMDLMPGLLRLAEEKDLTTLMSGIYKDIEYVKREVTELARSLYDFGKELRRSDDQIPRP